jgi:hypothetical protein
MDGQEAISAEDLEILNNIEAIETLAIVCAANDEPGTSLKIGDPPGTNCIGPEMGIKDMSDYVAPDQNTSNDANWNLSLPTNS